MTPEEFGATNAEIQKQNDGTQTNAQTSQNTSINLSSYNSKFIQVKYILLLLN